MPNTDPRPRRAILCGDYAYLSNGYYACQDAEIAGARVLPTCADTLDAYVVPIALEKAAKAGLAVPDWVLTHEYFPVPAVCYAVNPFSQKFAVVRDEDERRPVARRLTRNFKYSLCAQLMKSPAELVEFRMVGGRTVEAEFADWAARLFEVFRVPLATARLLRNGRLEFSSMDALPAESLTPKERAWAEELARG